jgi:hypothetical protein
VRPAWALTWRWKSSGELVTASQVKRSPLNREASFMFLRFGPGPVFDRSTQWVRGLFMVLAPTSGHVTTAGRDVTGLGGLSSASKGRRPAASARASFLRS